ncbi:hypothetical protein ACFQ9X_30830 [Catenulispora yoronensis]
MVVSQPPHSLLGQQGMDMMNAMKTTKIRLVAGVVLAAALVCAASPIASTVGVSSAPAGTATVLADGGLGNG